MIKSRTLAHVAGVAVIGALAVFGLLSHPAVTNSPRGGHFVTAAFDSTRPPACTHPAVVRDGLIELTCFPVIPAKQFPAAAKCSHIDSWVTGHSTETVNGRRYKITQKVRDDVWICKG
jgi:hypothetical protein